jgi:hypothetical protein
MRRPITALIAVCAVISLWASAASSSVRTVELPIPNLEMTFSQLVAPKKLPRVGATPIALELKGRIGTMDGSQPAAVEEFVLDLDKSIAIDARGLPNCEAGGRGPRFPDLKTLCEDAVVGSGRVGVRFQFPEQPPTYSASDLIVVNDSDQGTGATTLYGVSYFTTPITTALTMEIAIKKWRGRNRVIIKVPRFAGGTGSLTHLSANLEKRFVRDGEGVDLLTGSCPGAGTIQSEAKALFADGTILRQTSVRSCRPPNRR